MAFSKNLRDLETRILPNSPRTKETTGPAGDERGRAHGDEVTRAWVLGEGGRLGEASRI